MKLEERSSCRSPPRWILVPVSAFLLIGCGVISIVPLDESRFAPASLRFQPDHAPYRTRDVVFSHSVEAHAGEACSTCHHGMPDDTPPPPPPFQNRPARAAAAPAVHLPSMALCFKCHDGVSLSNDCIACHLTNRRDRKPGFHDGLFPRHHKQMAEREAYKCSLCHLEGDCRACHAERKPVSHTPRFERSTHGRLATHDRRSCATCHETSFCENCHSQPPPDHTALFRSGGAHRQAALIRGRSCIACHRFEDVCADCHR